jgi:ubiquinone biosynthesis protein Coq4
MTPSEKLEIFRDLKAKGYKGSRTSFLRKLQKGGPIGPAESAGPVAQEKSFEESATYVPIDGSRESYTDADGSERSEYKIGVNVGGKEWVIPTVWDGEQHTADQAYERFLKTGLHMGGPYDTIEEGERSAQIRTNIYNEHPAYRKYANGGLIKTKAPQRVVGKAYQDRKHHTGFMPGDVPKFKDGGLIDPPNKKKDFYNRPEFAEYNAVIKKIQEEAYNLALQEVNDPFYNYDFDVFNRNKYTQQDELENLYLEKVKKSIQNDPRITEMFQNAYTTAVQDVMQNANSLSEQNAKKLVQSKSKDNLQKWENYVDASKVNDRILPPDVDFGLQEKVTTNALDANQYKNIEGAGSQDFSNVAEKINKATSIGTEDYWNYLNENLPDNVVNNLRQDAENQQQELAQKYMGNYVDKAVTQNQKFIQNRAKPDDATLRKMGWDALVNPFDYAGIGVDPSLRNASNQQIFEAGQAGQRAFNPWNLIPFAGTSSTSVIPKLASIAPEIDMWTHILPSGVNAGAHLLTGLSDDAESLRGAMGIEKPTGMDYLNLGFTALGAKGVFGKGSRALKQYQKVKSGEDLTYDLSSKISKPSQYVDPSWQSRWSDRIKGITPKKEYGVEKDMFEKWAEQNPNATTADKTLKWQELVSEPTFLGNLLPGLKNNAAKFNIGEGSLTLGPRSGVYDANKATQEIVSKGKNFDIRKQNEGNPFFTPEAMGQITGGKSNYKPIFGDQSKEVFEQAASPTQQSIGYKNYMANLTQGSPIKIDPKVAEQVKNKEVKTKVPLEEEPLVYDGYMPKPSWNTGNQEIDQLLQNQIYEFPGLSEEVVVNATRNLMQKYPLTEFQEAQKALENQHGSGIAYEYFINSQLQMQHPEAYFAHPYNKSLIKGRTIAMKNFKREEPYRKMALADEKAFNQQQGLLNTEYTPQQLTAAGLYNHGFNKPMNNVLGSLYSLNQGPAIFNPMAQKLTGAIGKTSLVEPLSVGRRFNDYMLQPGTVYTPKGQGKGFDINSSPMWTSDLKEGMRFRADQPFMSTSKGKGLEDITPQTTAMGDQGKSLFGETTMQIGLKPGQNILHYNSPQLSPYNRYVLENEILLGNQGLFNVKSDYGKGTKGFDLDLTISQPVKKSKATTKNEFNYGNLKSSLVGAGSTGAFLYDYLNDGDGEATAAGLFGLLGRGKKGKRTAKKPKTNYIDSSTKYNSSLNNIENNFTKPLSDIIKDKPYLSGDKEFMQKSIDYNLNKKKLLEETKDWVKDKRIYSDINDKTYSGQGLGIKLVEQYNKNKSLDDISISEIKEGIEAEVLKPNSNKELKKILIQANDLKTRSDFYNDKIKNNEDIEVYENYKKELELEENEFKQDIINKSVNHAENIYMHDELRKLGYPVDLYRGNINLNYRALGTPGRELEKLTNSHTKQKAFVRPGEWTTDANAEEPVFDYKAGQKSIFKHIIDNKIEAPKSEYQYFNIGSIPHNLNKIKKYGVKGFNYDGDKTNINRINSKTNTTATGFFDYSGATELYDNFELKTADDIKQLKEYGFTLSKSDWIKNNMAELKAKGNNPDLFLELPTETLDEMYQKYSKGSWTSDFTQNAYDDQTQTAFRFKNDPLTRKDKNKGNSERSLDLEFYDDASGEWKDLNKNNPIVKDIERTNSKQEKNRAKISNLFSTSNTQLPEIKEPTLKDILSFKGTINNKNVQKNKQEIIDLENNLKEFTNNAIKETEDIRDLISEAEAQIYGEIDPTYLQTAKEYPEFTGFLLKNGYLKRFTKNPEGERFIGPEENIIDLRNFSKKERKTLLLENIESLRNALTNDELINRYKSEWKRSVRGTHGDATISMNDEQQIQALQDVIGGGQLGPGNYSSNSGMTDQFGQVTGENNPDTILSRFAGNKGTYGSIEIHSPELDNLTGISALGFMKQKIPYANSQLPKNDYASIIKNIEADKSISSGVKKGMVETLKNWEKAKKSIVNINSSNQAFNIESSSEVNKFIQNKDQADFLRAGSPKGLEYNYNRGLGNFILRNYWDGYGMQKDYTYGRESEIAKASERLILNKDRIKLTKILKPTNIGRDFDPTKLGPGTFSSVNKDLFSYAESSSIKNAIRPILNLEEYDSFYRNISDLKNDTRNIENELSSANFQSTEEIKRIKDLLNQYHYTEKRVKKEFREVLFKAGVLGIGGGGIAAGLIFGESKSGKKGRSKKKEKKMTEHDFRRKSKSKKE